MKRTFLALIVVTVLLLVHRLQLRSSSVETAGIAELQQENGFPVRIIEPLRMDISSKVGLTGQLEPYLSVPAQFDINGRLIEVRKDVGDPVEKGEIVARLDCRDQRAAVAAARADLALARAKWQKAMAGPRAQELKSARANAAGASASFELAKEELDRVKSLVKSRAAAQQQLDQAKSVYEAARARQTQAKQALALLEEGTREEDKEAAKASLDRARAQLEAALLRLDKHVLKAPIDGLVVEKLAEEGEVISSTPQPRNILAIQRQDPILFVCNVSEFFIPHLSQESEVQVRIDALESRVFTGRVHEISPSGSHSSRSFRVEFSIENEEGELKPAMFGRTKLLLKSAQDALTLPSHVLRPAESLEDAKAGKAKFVVMTVKDGRSAAQGVKVAFHAEGRVVLEEGIDEDSQVISKGFEELPIGVRVDIASDESNPSNAVPRQ